MVQLRNMKWSLTLLAVLSLINLGTAQHVSAHAGHDHYTIHLGARGPECGTQGYAAPAETVAPEGEVTIDFTNQQPVKLEVRGIPDGPFVVPGNSTVTRTFAARETITFTTRLETQDCQKAAATIKVEPAGTQGGGVVWVVVVAAIVTSLAVFHRRNKQRMHAKKTAGKE